MPPGKLVVPEKKLTASDQVGSVEDFSASVGMMI